MADSVLTSGCSFICQHIWIKICIVLAILGIRIKRRKFNSAGRSMWIQLSGQQIDDFGTLSSIIVTGRHGWHSGWRSRRLWTQLSLSVGLRGTCSSGSQARLRMLCGTIVTRNASVRVVLAKHCLVSFYRRLYLCMPRQLNTPLNLFLDFSARCLDQISCFLDCGVRIPSGGHFGHIQGQAYVRLFQLYPTSLSCHGSWHVENLQEIGCCF